MSSELDLSKKLFEDGISLMNRGLLIQAANKFIEASNYILNMKEVDEESRLLLVKSLINQGAIMINLGKFALAINSLLKSWQILKNGDNPMLLKATYINLINAFIATKRFNEANSFIKKLENIDEESKAYALLFRSKILIESNNTNDVLKYLEEAKSIFLKYGFKDQAAAVIATQAEYYFLIENKEKANEKIKEIKEIIGEDADKMLKNVRACT